MDFDSSLQDELDWVKDYLALESVNRGIHVSFSIETEDGLDLDAIAVPSFTLQPLFENALNYGKSEDGNVEITCMAESDANRLIITVTNSLRREDSPAEHPEERSGKASSGLRLLKDRLTNWEALRTGNASASTAISSEKTATHWQTVINLPLIGL